MSEGFDQLEASHFEQMSDKQIASTIYSRCTEAWQNLDDLMIQLPASTDGPALVAHRLEESFPKLNMTVDDSGTGSQLKARINPFAK